MKQPARTPLQLSESLHKRLNAYALAASAAGVRVLALTQAAEARIVYTPTHQVIRTGHQYILDLNNDGAGDFEIGVASATCLTNCHLRELIVFACQACEGNQISITGHSNNYLPSAAALKAGAMIPGKSSASDAALAQQLHLRSHYSYFGNWFNVKS